VEFTQQPGFYHALQLQLPYSGDTQRLYEQLCANKAHTLLLDSAEIQSRQHLKSIIMAQASLQFTCNGNTVTIKALTTNGAQVLPFLAEQLDAYAQIETSQDQLSCHFVDFNASTAELDEEQRLRSAGNEQPLRLILQKLQAADNAPAHEFALFVGGVFGYDYIASMEQLPEVADGPNTCPDYQFYLAESLIIVDHQAQTTELLGTLLSGPAATEYYPQLARYLGEIAAHCQLPLPQQDKVAASVSSDVSATPSAERYSEWIAQLKEHIADGDIFQVVPSRTFSLACPDSLAAYAQLKASNPSPYMFYLQAEDFVLFGASPESALKYSATTRQVELYPIAGTRPRGKRADGSLHPDLDSRLELELRCDQKELSEHLMLVDLARNDLARIAEPGSRYVADLLQVDRYSHVMHLVSRVVATLAADLDALHAYRACMNMGTLVGAPKVSAATLIRQFEQQRRGSYGGAVGYLNGKGDMDTCIVIRAAFVRDQQAYVQAGAGIVADSQAAAEVAETENKARAVIAAIQATQQGARA
jgi:anthranilate synthase component 1